MVSVGARRVARWGSRSRTLLATVVLLASAGLAPPAAANDALRIGIQNERPPFSFSDDDGKLQGFDIDIAQALCAVLELSPDNSSEAGGR
jgi:ABC-type amino acid transport substrate-binding protein